MTRRYLVYVETLIGLGDGTRAPEPIGIVGVSGTHRLNYIDRARATARLQFNLKANQRAHCVLDTAGCNAIDRLMAAGKATTVAEALATVRRRQAERRARRVAKGGPARAPHGAGLL